MKDQSVPKEWDEMSPEEQAIRKAWGMVDDTKTTRERHRAKYGQTDKVDFRMDSGNYRALQEIVASQKDPRLKTVSDCIQDAVALFLKDWIENFKDGLSGRALREVELDNRQRERDYRQRYLDKTRDDIDHAIAENDEEGLYVAMIHINAEIEDAVTAPASFIEELEHHARTAQVALDRMKAR